MLVCCASGLAQGTYSAWTGIIYPVLRPLDFTQDECAWIGFVSTLGSIFGGLTFGKSPHLL